MTLASNCQPAGAVKLVRSPTVERYLRLKLEHSRAIVFVTVGALAVASPALADVMIEAERLSAVHSETLGTRSLDVLHVASALVLGSSSFLSFDRRQRALARAAGLKVPSV